MLVFGLRFDPEVSHPLAGAFIDASLQPTPELIEAVLDSMQYGRELFYKGYIEEE